MVSLFERSQIACIMKNAGFDFFIIDCEHGPFDYSHLAGILLLAKETGIPALVRVPEPRREVILKCMEMGARGLLLPNTETAEQAAALVTYSKYAPLGNRGVALIREHTGFKPPEDVVKYMKETNEETLLMIQIESPRGLENLGSILDVEGIDVAFVGPSDLSQSMGIMGQLDNPKFIGALEKLIAKAAEKGKYSGIHLMDTEKLKFWMDKGMKCNMYSSDVNLLMTAGKTGLKALRS
jgi:2-dehydro-3-deoxyglucarate aldolase/4-hydroxy-2-oxoheptanedioate aldolase